MSRHQSDTDTQHRLRAVFAEQFSSVPWFCATHHPNCLLKSHVLLSSSLLFCSVLLLANRWLKLIDFISWCWCVVHVTNRGTSTTSSTTALRLIIASLRPQFSGVLPVDHTVSANAACPRLPRTSIRWSFWFWLPPPPPPPFVAVMGVVGLLPFSRPP